jgi:hypothetical protein
VVAAALTTMTMNRRKAAEKEVKRSKEILVCAALTTLL